MEIVNKFGSICSTNFINKLGYLPKPNFVHAAFPQIGETTEGRFKILSKHFGMILNSICSKGLRYCFTCTLSLFMPSEYGTPVFVHVRLNTSVNPVNSISGHTHSTRSPRHNSGTGSITDGPASHSRSFSSQDGGCTGSAFFRESIQRILCQATLYGRSCCRSRVDSHLYHKRKALGCNHSRFVASPYI